MEQRSQILKQMHLTKNEREREVRLPLLGSQSLKLLPALGLHRLGMAQGWHTSPTALLITLFLLSLAPHQWGYTLQLHLPSLLARMQRSCGMGDRLSPLYVTSGAQWRRVDPKYVWMMDRLPVWGTRDHVIAL